MNKFNKIAISALFASLLPNIAFADTPVPTQKSIEEQFFESIDQRKSDIALFKSTLNKADEKSLPRLIQGLGRIGGYEIVPIVANYLSHANEEARIQAVLALGISGSEDASAILWEHLSKEKNELVKAEIYLAIGNHPKDGLISRLLQQVALEKSELVKKAIFQSMGTTLVFNRSIQDNYDKFDFQWLLSLIANGDNLASRVAFFLDRIPQISERISTRDLLSLSQKNLDQHTSIFLARLIAKMTETDQKENRALLAWLIEKSEPKPENSLQLQIEATRSMRNLIAIPQTLIQLGKLQASSNPIIAQTALKTLGDSKLDTDEVIKLFKKQLSSNNDAMVVEALRALIKRQSKDDMSWMLKLFSHPSHYVKINLIQLLKDKKDDDFTNVIKMFEKAPDKHLSQYASNALNDVQDPKDAVAASTSYMKAKNATTKTIVMKTSLGEIEIQMLPDAPFTAWHFVENVKSGFYNGSYFNRVIGNFVAQGGDIIGDGSGSNFKTIREEISLVPHEPMTVGMATLGKDTGTTQFFINTARNFHLDRHYTIFGKVISGQEIVFKMTHGVKVLEMSVQ